VRLSSSGLEFLSQEEGLVLKPYNDSAGHATVGVGHLIHRGPVTAADRARYGNFTRADAIKLLKRDAAIAEDAVNQLVNVPINRNEFHALVSLVFNIGAGERGFAGSTVLRKLNANDRRSAADAFLMWRIGGAGLINRRKRERKIFLTPMVAEATIENPASFLTAGEQAWVSEYDELKAKDQDRPRRSALREAMTQQRKKIWRAAQESGWDKAHRKERYDLLRARTA
jgi:lysozyme